VNNFEKIKAMDIDELANWFTNRYAVCDLEIPCENCINSDWCCIETKEDFKKWLLSTKN
jgi:hypothetical protein